MGAPRAGPHPLSRRNRRKRHAKPAESAHPVDDSRRGRPGGSPRELPPHYETRPLTRPARARGGRPGGPGTGPVARGRVDRAVRPRVSPRDGGAPKTRIRRSAEDALAKSRASKVQDYSDEKRSMSLSRRVAGAVPGRPFRFFAEMCTSHSRTTVGTALSSAKCTFRLGGFLMIRRPPRPFWRETPIAADAVGITRGIGAGARLRCGRSRRVIHRMCVLRRFRVPSPPVAGEGAGGQSAGSRRAPARSMPGLSTVQPWRSRARRICGAMSARTRTVGPAPEMTAG